MMDANDEGGGLAPAVEAAAEVVDKVEQAEGALAREAGRYREHPLVRAAGGLSELADQPQLTALCGAVIAWGLVSGDRRLARCGGHMLASFALATAVKTVVKAVVARSRPNMLVDKGVQEISLLGPNEGPWNSFPSGHTAGAVAAARAVARIYPGARAPAYAVAGAVAAAQIPRCAHYPSDVAAGALVGVAAELAARRLFPLVRPLARLRPALWSRPRRPPRP